MLEIDRGKILIEGMDLSGKTTIVELLKNMIEVSHIQCRTLIENNSIHDFTVQQSKSGNLPRQLISELYRLSIMEDLCKYEKKYEGLVIQDSYFALRSYAYEKSYGSNKMANEMKKYLQMFPKPEFTFYLKASIKERIARNEKRDKTPAYMEKLLISEPEKFENIEKNLQDIVTDLFKTEIIDTNGKEPFQIAQYICNKIKELGRNNYEKF